MRVAFSQCSTNGPAAEVESEAVGATCAFLYALFMTLPTSRVIMGLAYKAQLVPQLWPHIKRYHGLQTWPSIELKGRNTLDIQNSRLLGWMLPLAVFCPVYRWVLSPGLLCTYFLFCLLCLLLCVFQVKDVPVIFLDSLCANYNFTVASGTVLPRFSLPAVKSVQGEIVCLKHMVCSLTCGPLSILV